MARAEATEHPVITVISDDDDDDETELLPSRRRTAAQQHASPQEVDLTHDEPGPRTRAATAAAAAAHSPTKRTPTKKSPKKQTPLKAAAAAAAASAGQTGADSDGDDSGSSCIICMELMAEQGGHRPAALKCGHIFGENCIKRWLKEKSRCPQCNKQARVREITALFNLPKKVAAGRGESAAALEQELQEAQMKAKQEQERARLLEQQLERANRELARQQRQQRQQSSHQPPPPPPPRRQPPRLQQQQQHPPPPLPYQQQQYQQPHMAWLLPPCGTLPGLPMTYAVQADAWSCSVLRLMQGQHLPDAEMTAFLHHPNTALYFGSQFSSIMLQQQGLQGPQVGQQAVAGGQSQQQQQQQVLQVHRQALQAAVAGRKRTMEQSIETDAGAAGGLPAAAARGVGGGSSSLSALPAAAAAAAAAEARARASGPAATGLDTAVPGAVWPGLQQAAGPAPIFVPSANISGIGTLGSGSGTRKHVVQLSLLPVQHAAAADGMEVQPQQQQEQQQTQAQVAAAEAFPAEYLPAQQFLGPRKGYVFEMGRKGLGYYRDPGPFTLAGRAAAGSFREQRVLQMPGSFSLLQEYELTGSRAFDLDVEGMLLTVAEVLTNGPPGFHRLRRISMLAPGTPMYITLPQPVGAVRCLARQPLPSGSSSSSSSALMAVATDKAGLIIAKPSTNNIIASVPTQAPVWSVAWSHRHEQQLILGLDKGRLAVVDLRMTGSRALLLMTAAANSSSAGRGSCGAGSGVTWLPAAAPATVAAAAMGARAQPPPLQPWHSLVALPRDWQQQHAADVGEDWATPEALLACTAGVYCWSSAQPDSFQQLLPASYHGGTCEGLALAPDECTIAASFRRPIVQQPNGMNDIQPEHWLARLQPAPEQPSVTAAAVRLAAPAAVGAAAAAVNSDQAGGSAAASIGNSLADAVSAGRQALATSTLRLTGHSSMQAMTHGCFMPALPDMSSEQLMFASADEGSREPRLWGCSSGAGLVQRQPWQAMSTPVLQLVGGRAAAFDTMLLGVLSERQLKLYSYTCG